MSDGEGNVEYDNGITICNNLYTFENDTTESDSKKQYSINTKHTKCVYVVSKDATGDLYTGTDSDDPINYTKLEYAASKILDSNNIYDENRAFNYITGSILSGYDNAVFYGGNTYEARSLNNYNIVSSFAEISAATNSSINIDGTGDTYFRQWTFARSVEGDLTREAKGISINETMSVPLETYIDLNSRYDNTKNLDKTKLFIQSLEDYEQEDDLDNVYQINDIYSTWVSTITEAGLGYGYSYVDYFPSLIRASKVKTSSESIDSFTDILTDEETLLNSAYGEITNIEIFNDAMYVFMDNAVAYQYINPTAQVVSDDGLSVELGTGSLFGKTQYLSTNTGVRYLDRFSVTKGSNSIYFLDRNNYSINSITGNNIVGLSSVKFISKLIQSKLDKSSTIGSIGAFDFIKDSLYLSLPTSDDESETIVYNEKYQEFIYVKTINPELYLQSRDGVIAYNQYDSFGSVPKQLFLIEGDNDDYNSILNNNNSDDDYISSLTNASPKLIVLAKPKEYASSRFDDIEWNSILNSDDNINGNILESVRAYNSEQDTDIVSDILPRNKFNMWRLNLPRHGSNKVGNRLNGRWLYIDMYLSNSDYQYNIHNIGINYQNKK